ncbi:MAG: ABC transporter permease [Methanomassiliicoccales archaeon]
MKLKNVIANFGITARNFSRSREGLFFTFIFPIVFVAIFGSIFAGNLSGTVPLYVQNQAGNAPAVQEFLSSLNQTHLVSVKFIPSEVNVTSYLSRNSITTALVVPSNFTSDVQNSTPVYLKFYYNPAESSSQIASEAIGAVVQQMNLKLSGGHDVIFIAEHTDSVVATTYVDFLVPGLIGFTILTTPTFGLTFLVSNYRKEKIFRQLSFTPLTRGEWLLSQFLWYIVIAFLSAAEMVAFGVYAFHVNVSISLYIVPLLLIGVFMFVSLGIFLGSIAKSEEGASVVGNIVTFPMMFLAGTFFPISIMPGWLQQIAHVLPLFYIIDGLNDVMVYTNYSAAFLDVLISLIISIFFFLLAIFTFSWKEA